MREKLHNFFAKHSAAAHGLRWFPTVASPGIDDLGHETGVQRSFAGVAKVPPNNVGAVDHYVRVETIGNYTRVGAVRR